jgi:hypothetical protein
MKTTKMISVVLSVLVILVALFVMFTLQYEVSKPKEWSANVKIYRRSITGETRVFDATSGKFLFSYRPEYDPNVRPTKIDQLDQNHWQVILENPDGK